MFIEKNERGNIVFYQSHRKDKIWGHIDESGDYLSERKFKSGQIFRFFKNAIALQLELLEYLERRDKKKNIKIRVPDYENEPFWAIIKVGEFRQKAIEEFGKRAIFNYDRMNYARYGRQIMCPMHSFTRVYDNQEILKC